MKTTLQVILTLAFLIGLGTERAHAGSEGWAALGGFVAGVVTGSVINDPCDRGHVRVTVGSGGRGSRYGYHGYYGPEVRYYDPRWDRRPHSPSGHWEIHNVKVWVPGRWEVRINPWGQRIRVWRSGYHTWHRERVWVPHRGRW